tara:strand:+ start:8174 stop:8968 length:795 start_codon:yes stop_codon:yes gene_type:complete
VSNALHVRSTGAGEAVLVLHGLFGSGNNLGALTRSLQADYAVHALDLPGHGRSSWLEHYSLENLAARVSGWLEERHLPAVHVVGHSLGGKVAMQLALTRPGQVRSLVVADMAPVAYPAQHAAVLAALEAVALAEPESRDDALYCLRGHVAEAATQQFLLASLYRDEQGVYRWRFDWQGLARDYAMLSEAPTCAAAWPGPALFIRGGNSHYVPDAYRPAIFSLFPAARIDTLDGCGHWVHVEQPQRFNGRVARFLAEAATDIQAP